MGNAHHDTVDSETKQLDYYEKLGVTLEKYAKDIKQYQGANSSYWLRVYSGNILKFNMLTPLVIVQMKQLQLSLGVSPAFRIV